MTAIDKRYRFRVATAGAAVVAGNVDWTETVNVASVGEIGGQTVHPTKGQTTARPWSIEIVDVAEVITARLSDANGRAHLLRRLADVSVSTDGGSSWTVLATARVDRIEMVDVSSFRFTMQDERVLERTTTIFKGSNTTRIMPRGLSAAWLVYAGARSIGYQVTSVDTVNDVSRYTFIGNTDEDVDPPVISEQVLELLEADVVDAPANYQGNFRTLRVNVNGVDREVLSINGSPPSDPLKKLREEPRRWLRFFDVADYEDTNGFTRAIYFHMASRDPSPELPLHIGGQAGVDPFSFVKDLYDGDYQAAANPSTVRYEAARFTAYDPATNPHGLIDNPRFPRMHFRVTGPENMAEWLEDNIYRPLGVVPFINAAGEVSPRIALMPAVDQVADPDTLPQLTAANLTKPHPGWVNDGRELITVVEVTFEYAIAPSYIRLRATGGLFGGLLGGGLVLPTEGGQDVGVDLLTTKTLTLSKDHDRAADFRAVEQLTVRGFHRPLNQRAFLNKFALDMFERFGDGPIYTDAAPLSTGAAPGEGDWVRINLPGSYPALQNQSRTGTRIAQVLSKVYALDGVRFELLEGGPNDQPMGTPTIALAANAEDPENAIDVTVSGLEAGGSYEAHFAVAALEPAEDSSDWQFRHARGSAVSPATSAAFTVRGVPAGSTIWGRARETAVHRISSDWSTADSQATTGLTAPSGLAASGLQSDAAVITWTNGEASFDVMVDLILQSGGAQVVAPVRLPAGTTLWRFLGLTGSTGYTARVWHVDDYGGASSKGTVNFSTTSTATALPKPRSIRVLVGAT